MKDFDKVPGKRQVVARKTFLSPFGLSEFDSSLSEEPSSVSDSSLLLYASLNLMKEYKQMKIFWYKSGTLLFIKLTFGFALL